jgi:UDP-xylose/UDP-N-acetylglucosamine transporter B4
MTASRRRQAAHKSSQQASSGTTGTKDRGSGQKPSTVAKDTSTTRVINAAPSLEKAEMYGIDDTRPVFSRAMALAGRVFIETIPQWLAVGAMLSLIFGGCCSNVFALEAIVKVEPASGMSLTESLSQDGGVMNGSLCDRQDTDFLSLSLQELF